MSKKQHIVVILVLVFDVALCIFGFWLTRTTRQSIRVGSLLVDLMYNFDDFESLPDKYRQLYQMVDDEVWEDVDANRPYRFAWAYKRFRGTYCHSVVEMEHAGTVIYRMHTPYISPQRHWCIKYTVDAGYINSLKEYELEVVSTSGDGGKGLTYFGP